MVTRRGASTEKGVRFAARQIIITLDPLLDPERGRGVPPEPWDRLLAKMAADDELTALRPRCSPRSSPARPCRPGRCSRRSSARTRDVMAALGYDALPGAETEPPATRLTIDNPPRSPRRGGRPAVGPLMSDLADLLAVVQAQARQIAALEDRVAKLIRVGPVTDSEHGKGVRVDLGGGEDGKPNKSTWLQNADATGATSVRPRVGDQVVVLSPNGDQEQASSTRSTIPTTARTPAPDGETSVLWNRDDVSISIKGGVCTIVAKKIVLKSGDASYMLDGKPPVQGRQDQARRQEHW